MEDYLSSLKPIRDLAQNWDIDIASCLEDYLQELVEISANANVNILPNNQVTNFTQAAILVQNSSNIYSRKVEYLHSLVYDALTDLLASAASKNPTKGKEKKLNEAQREIHEFEIFDPDLNFLLLDEVLPTVDEKNKNRLLLSGDKSIKCRTNESHDSHSILQQNQDARFSIGDLSLTKLDETKNGFGYDINKTNMCDRSVSSKLISRVLLQGAVEGGNEISEGGSSGALRLLSGRCAVSESGLLLIPGSCFGDDEVDLKEAETSVSYQHIHDAMGQNSTNEDSVPDQELQEVLVEGQVPFTGNNLDSVVNDNEMETDFDLCDNNDTEIYDDENDGVGFQLASDNSNINDQNHMRSPIAPPPPALSKPDPWLLLDPHSEANCINSKSFLLRIGKTYRLPPGILVPPAECVTGASTKSTHVQSILRGTKNSKQVKRRSSRAGYSQAGICFESMTSREQEKDVFDIINDVEHSHNEQEQSLENSQLEQTNNSSDEDSYNVNFINERLPLNGLIFGDEYAYIAKASEKHRNGLKYKQEVPSGTIDCSMKIRHQIENDQKEEEQYMIGNHDIDQDSFGDEHIVDEPHNFDVEDFQDDGNVDFSCFDNMLDNEYASEVDKARKFEELCHAHIKAFSRGSEKYASETQLSRRIDDWQTKVIPILEEEKNRTEFDVHEYGERIIRSMKEDMEEKRYKRKRKGAKNIIMENIPPPETVDFQSITADCEQHEVCRLFVTSLMLSNSGNIKLSQKVEGTPILSTDMLHLKLLSTKLELPIEMYRLHVTKSPEIPSPASDY